LKEKIRDPKFPATKQLAEGLTAALRDNGFSQRKMTILNRRPNPYNSTFPTEIIKCRLNSIGKTLGLFVKYETGKFDSAYGHRGNVSYEAKVYREILNPLALSTPKFYGIYNSESDGATWLITEYMGRGVPASWSKDPKAMTRSARWIGKFHAANEKRIQNSNLNFLRRYDEDYYIGWSQRTKRLFRRVHAKFPWLIPLCNEFEKRVSRLLSEPQTVVHGEYFGSNIVYQQGVSRPIDWQSTAVAAGEVDLASLTHSWASNVVQNCEREYTESRWPMGAPASFQETLEVARVYMSLRWLGDPRLMSPLVTRQGRPVVSKNVFLAMQTMLELRLVGKRLGLTREPA